MSAERLLERFLRYVRVDTTASDSTGTSPSSPGQLELGRILVNELLEIGLADARQDEHGIVLATAPATVGRPTPAIALCAHLDTSPETTGANVKPQVLRAYRGGDITLPGDPDRVIRVSDNPELAHLVGRTLITSDGTTLLGADDKAGVAVIVETAAQMMEDRSLPHGPIRVCFTCDEEIGRGVVHLPPEKIGAAACYTLDGQGSHTIDVETFSADLAVVKIRGVNIHPSIAKGRMVNAVRVAAEFVGRLPRHFLSPETTDQREGFLHPYQVRGGVGEVELRILLRDFETAALADHAEQVRSAADAAMAEFPGAHIDVMVERQYRNMAEGLPKEPRAVGYALEALARLGSTAKLESVRGGTDGSRLTEMGLPTPNLATGQHTPHSPLEWACLDEMIQAVDWLVAISARWAEP